MGSVRDLSFDAVLGIGSLSPWRGDQAIAGKVTWIGVGPFRTRGSGRGSRVSFEKFLLLDGQGPLLASEAPALAERFYVRNARWVLRSYSPNEQRELDRLFAKLLEDPRCVTSRRTQTGARQAAHREAGCRTRRPRRCHSIC